MRSLLRALVACGLVLTAVTACGDDSGETATDTSAESPGDTTTTAPETSTNGDGADAEAMPLSVYLLDEEGLLRVGHVRRIESPAVAQGTMESLLAGPTAEDEALGLSTAIPEGTELRGVVVAGGVATVDLSSEFGTGGGSASMQARLAQVVYTLTQFPTVESVELLIDGQPVDALGGEGVLVEDELTRADFQFGGTYETLEPIVLVETPRPGERVTGTTIDVGGSANTFEAGVYLEVVDEAGEVLVPETYLMASSGSGTTGVFLETLELPEGTSGPVTIRAYDLSPEDGSREGLVEVPVAVAG